MNTWDLLLPGNLNPFGSHIRIDTTSLFVLCRQVFLASPRDLSLGRLVMNILFVATESVPFCKTGGLAEVVRGLARELAPENDVRVCYSLLPRLAR